MKSKLTPIAAAIALAGAVSPAFANNGAIPLVLKASTPAPVYRIAEVGSYGIAVIDRDNVLWTTSRESHCAPGGTPVPYFGHAGGTGNGATQMDANGWTRTFSNVDSAFLALFHRSQACQSGIGSQLKTLDNRIYLSGQNNNGACLGTPAPAVSTYTVVPWTTYTNYDNVKQWIPEDLHALWVVKSDGSVWSRGHNSHGQQGTGSAANIPSTVSSCSTVSWGQRIPSGAAKVTRDGLYTTVVVMQDGTLRAVGLNDNGQFGWRTTATYSTAGGVVKTGSLTWVTSPGTVPPLKDYRQIQTNLSSTSTLTTLYHRTDDVLEGSIDGAVTRFTIGSGVKRVIEPFATRNYLLPLYYINSADELVQVTGPSRVTTVERTNVADVKMDSENNLIVLHKNGEVSVRGPNAHGQLGNGTTTAISSWTTIASNAVEVAIGSNRGVAPYYGASAILKSDGTLWVAGFLGTSDVGFGRFSAFGPTIPGVATVTRHFQIPTPGSLSTVSGTP